MKTLQWAAAALAVGALALPSGAETVTTNDWWDVQFDVDGSGRTPAVTVDGHAYGGTTLQSGELGPITNNASLAGFNPEALGNQPWASGYWAMTEGDESYWTNDWYVAEGDMPTFTNSYLKLDTQGNDLTWTPTNVDSVIQNVTTLVDADLYLVGSDSPPDADFDKNSNVQTAIYLKNELYSDDHPQAGETSNSVLCVYAWDPHLNNNAGGNYWQELKGVTWVRELSEGETVTQDGLKDNSWVHVRVSVDHSVSPARISVYVNGTQMTARDGNADYWPVANRGSQTIFDSKTVSSVAFRGTGAVDNFTGTTVKKEFESHYFTAAVHMNGNLVAAGDDVNQTKVVYGRAGSGQEVKFRGFEFHDQVWVEDAWNEEDQAYTGNYVTTYALARIVISNCVDGSVQTFNYGYDREAGVTLPETLTPAIYFQPDTYEDEKTGEVVEYYSGPFEITVSTEGAEKDETLVYIYFEDLPEEGEFKLKATQNVGTAPADQTFNVDDDPFPENATFTFADTLTTDGKNYVLSKIVPGAAPAVVEGASSAGEISVSYASPTVTVTVPISTDIKEGTYNVATATYVEGTIPEGKIVKLVADGEGGYNLEVSDPPVAIIVADSGATTNEYATLAAAIAAVEADASTTTTVTLISSVNEDVVIPAGKNVELDLFGNAITNVASDTISVYGTLLLKDSSENTNGIVASAIASKAALVNYPTGSVTIEAGTIAVPDDATYYNIKNMGAMTIEEGAVIVSRVSTKSTLIANGWYGNAAVDRDTTGQPNTAILTINGGVFDGGLNVVKNDDYGILVIEGGTFSNLSDVDAVILNWNDTTINGGEFTGVTKILCNGSYGANSADKGVMTINGGTFRANGEQGNLFGYGTEGGKMSDALLEITGGTFYGHVAGLGDNDGTLGVAAISGGSFSEVVPQIYCAEGYVPVTTPDPDTSLYTVGKGAVQISIAGEVKTFGSIADAQAAAATAEIADPVFTIIDELSAETVTLAYGDTLKIIVAEDGDITDLSVETSATGDDQYAYEVVNETDAETGVTTYSVVRTVKTYAVTFTVDGTTVATTNAPYGDTLYGPSDPVKTAETGYEVAFAGWTNAVAGGATVTAANLPEVTGDATWAAVFTTTAIEYTVTVALDGGTLASGDSIPATYTVETAAFTLPTPTKEGFTFKGWVDGDNQPVTQIAGGTTGDISLTATWEEDSVEVHVNPGDGLDTIENAPAPIEFTAAGLCKIAFKAPAAGKYVLMTSETVNGTYLAEGTPVEFAAGALVELTETTAGTTKFFKIGYEK